MRSSQQEKWYAKRWTYPRRRVLRLTLKGGVLIAPLTLRQCLEHVMALGTDYVVTEQSVECTVTKLLAALSRSYPNRLDLPMYLRLPDAQQDGAICQLTDSGGYILRYRICRHTPR